MTDAAEQTSSYVLGHSERELARLEQQAGLFAEGTRDVLLRAGIQPGMKVLDLGCGVGDVSAVAAELVGPQGQVLGLDLSADAVAVAERRMQAAGKTWTSFVAQPIESFDRFGEFDAVIGRFLLIHIQQPETLLQMIAQKTRSGTVIAFMEMDMSTAAALPPLPLLQANLERIMEVYRRTGRQMDMGSRLYSAYRAAGLKPRLAGFTRIGEASDSAGLDFVTESVRSLVPAMGMLGIATAEEIEVDTLRDRLKSAAQDGEYCVFYPRLVGAWAVTGR